MGDLFHILLPDAADTRRFGPGSLAGQAGIRENPEFDGSSRWSVQRQKANTGSAEFYVVGGPVQPDRSCYVERPADRELFWRLRDGDFCHVLGPRQIGKSSLLARTTKRLREQGALVAVVDLTQIGSRDKGIDAGRWYYGVAYRVVRELRIKVDLQTWWQARSNLSQVQRLNEFYWSIVLAHTTAPVVIFFDELESLLPLPFAHDFLASIRAAHDARATESDYRRLRFALIGVATPRQLGAPSGQAPFSISHQVPLADFTLEQARPLIQGLGLSEAAAERVLRRILFWTSGQPYLTQKLCRAAARRRVQGDRDEAVDRIVAELFLSPGVIQNEPNLNLIRARLTDRSGPRNTALSLYGRIAKGERVLNDPGSVAQDALKLAGIIILNTHQRLVVRNRIYRKVFTARWVNQNLPFDIKVFAVAAAVGAIILAVPLWYTQLLPKPYIETLSVATEDLEVAMDAYDTLRSIPGYRDRADRLLADVMERRSRGATTYAEVLAADRVLRSLAGNETRADSLLAYYWDKRAQLEAMRENRDGALLARIRALVVANPERRRAASHLIALDYEQLQTMIRTEMPIEDAILTPEGDSVVAVIGGHRVQSWSADTGLGLRDQPMEFTAEEYVPLTRRLEVSAPGSVTDMRMSVAAAHPRPTDLGLRLTSPSGRTVVLNIADGRRRGDGEYVFSIPGRAGLEELVGESIRGNWTLSIEDRVSGVTGVLAGWGLQFGSERFGSSDTPVSPLTISDPRVTSQVLMRLSRSGRHVAVTSRSPDSQGDISVWDLSTGQRTAHLVRDFPVEWVDFATDERILVAASVQPRGVIRAWNLERGTTVMSIDTTTGLVLGPVLSPDQRFLALAYPDRWGNRYLRIWDLATGRLRSSLGYAVDLAAVAVAPGGAAAATIDRNGLLQLLDVDAKRSVASLDALTPIKEIQFHPNGRWLAAVDSANLVSVWELERGGVKTWTPALRAVTISEAALRFSRSSDTLAVPTGSTAVEIFGLANGQRLGAPLRPGAAWRGPREIDNALRGPAVFDATGEKLLVALDTQRMLVWRPGVLGREDLPTRSLALSAAASPVGRGLAVVRPDGSVELTVAEGETTTLLAAADHEPWEVIRTLAFSDDGRFLFGGGQHGQFHWWNLSDGGAQPSVVAHDLGIIWVAAFSPDGGLLATGGESGTRLWDPGTSELRHALGPNDQIFAVAFSPDGDQLATGGASGELAVWWCDDGSQLAAFPTDGAVTAVAYSPDGTQLASGTDTGAISVWNLGAGSGAASVRVGGGVRSLHFSPDGNYIVAVSDEWVHLLNVTPGGLGQKASALLPAEAFPGTLHGVSPYGQTAQLVGWLPGSGYGPVKVSFGDGQDPPVEGDPQDLLESWRLRLKLAYDHQGDLVPWSPGEPVSASRIDEPRAE